MKRLPLLLLLSAAVFTVACQKQRDPATPAEMKAKLEPKVRMAMWKIDATSEQEKAVDALLDVLAADLYGFQQENKAITRRIIDALDDETIDTATLAKVQKDGLALFDRYTRRMMSVAGDLAKILTMEQRKTLVDLWRDWEFGE